MSTWLLLSGTAASGVRSFVFLCLAGRLLSLKKRKKGRLAVSLTLAMALFGLLVLLEVPVAGCMALEVCWLTFCVSRFQGAEMRLALFLGIFYEIATGLWQFLTAAWCGVLFHSAAVMDGGTGKGQAAVWMFHALLLLAALCVCKGQRLTGETRWESWEKIQRSPWGRTAFRLASAIVVAGFIAVVTLSQQRVLAIADDTLDLWTMLSVILMIGVLVFHMNRQYEMEKELSRLKSEQAQLLERDYTALNNAYAVNAKLFHDFHNHIGVLRQLLSHEKTAEAVQYLDALKAPVRELTDTVWTGDETVDYLINSKAAAAKERGIPFRAQVEFPRHTNLQSADLSAILGNLLDNAIEAAAQVEEPGERQILLTIRRINQMLVIKVENSFCVLPVTEGGGLKTTKEEAGLHGWGLKSARTAAEKYDGTVQTAYGEGVFWAVATLSYQGVKNTDAGGN